MDSEGRNGHPSTSVGDEKVKARKAVADAKRAIDADQTAADADQTASDADQTASDEDQTASTMDQAIEDLDQRASDRDQLTADRDRATGSMTAEDESAYAMSRGERETVSLERLGNRLKRATTAHERDVTARTRDRIADARDEAGHARDVRAADLIRTSTEPEAAALMQQLEDLAAQAAADRARAAADRARASSDRATAARERARLEAELDRAHLDELTGVYRRGMGRMALTHEIERARRSDGGFVLAFIDVDRLKMVNDREGHAAGDRVLQTVVRVIQTKLRSFDPIMRYGGDEFVCGLNGTDLAEAKHRFETIAVAIEADAHVGISVGLAALKPTDTVDQLTERADAAMLKVKARHHSRVARPARTPSVETSRPARPSRTDRSATGAQAVHGRHGGAV